MTESNYDGFRFAYYIFKWEILAVCTVSGLFSYIRCKNLELRTCAYRNLRFMSEWGGGGGGGWGTDDDVRKQLGYMNVCNSSEISLPFTLRQASLVAVSLFCKEDN